MHVLAIFGILPAYARDKRAVSQRISAEGSPRVEYDFVKTEEQLERLCRQLETVQTIAFDTEFVSEFTYYPDLGLVQLASADVLAVVDPREVDVSRLWQFLAAGNRKLVVHAGREEYRFLRRATGLIPPHWFDIQIAAGMVGLDYPASYGKLLHRLLGKKLHKGETRTDWRKRPLSESQIEYALQDVIHLIPLRDKLYGQLEKMGRLGWFQGEIDSWRQRTEDGESRGRWRRVNGTSGLSRRSLTVVKELWFWREEKARQRDCLPRRVLRDDLIVELARRARPGVSQIRAVRGFERRDLQKHLPEISACIERALAKPVDPSDYPHRPDLPPQIGILAQFLNTALTSMCHRASISPGIVGTVQDVRDLIAHELGIVEPDDEIGPPILTDGWRGELVGRQLVDLLAGRKALRITDPLSDKPLTYE